ncbi:MAG: M20/M25/M40 family metallo-hydrolase [Deltaproteobacteria bacterium]|nr:M20/M25/M40 family metallo-hydrolase [Deltaproteobacteria bacterium]
MSLDSKLQKFAVDELSKLVRIPSISFPGFDPKHVEKSGEATAELLKRVGFQNIQLKKVDECFPYVVGEIIVDKKLPTALLYAHHDVQPPGREEIWKTAPFEPTLKDGRLYGRGTADDKAGILVHAAAAEYYKSYVNSSAMPMNLKVIIEGEEEIGSSHLLEFLKQNQTQLQSDVIIVTDTANIDCGVPSLTVSLRGLVVVDVDVRSLKAPLHSGMWGGGVVDPVQVLVKMLAALTDKSGNILLPSIKPSLQRKLEIPVGKEIFAKQAGVLKENSVSDNFWHRIWYEPSLSINAIQASSEKLANNVICDRAFARVGIRVTKSESGEQISKELVEKLKNLCKEISNDSVELHLHAHSPSNAWETDPNSKQNAWAFRAADQALQKAFGRKSVNIGCGGSIPFIGPFEKALEAPVITLGVEDPFTLAHSENESLGLDDFYKAIEAEIEMFQTLAAAFKSR